MNNRCMAAVTGLILALSVASADCISISTSFDRVRVRESAHLKSRVIGLLEKNVEIPGIPSGGQWFEIAGGDYPGAFVAAEFLKVRLNRQRAECAETAVTVVARGMSVRVRETPDLNGKIAGTIDSSDPSFDVVLGPPGWLKIRPPHGKAGFFISEDWVKVLAEKISKPTHPNSEH